MQFNIVPRTGGFAINRKSRGKRGCDGIILTVVRRCQGRAQTSW